MEALQTLRGWVVALQGLPVFPGLCRAIYRLAAWVFARAVALALGRSLSALYLRRGAAGEDWAPGVSDIDLLLVIGGGCPAPLLRRVWRAYRLLRAAFPMIGEMQVAEPEELSFWARHGSVRRREIPSWKRLAGRGEAPAPGPGGRRLQEAVSACLFLADAYFGYRGADFGHRIAKGFLDVCRFGGPGEGPPTRREQRESMRGRWPLLASPGKIGRAEALGFMQEAMARFGSRPAGRLEEKPVEDPWWRERLEALPSGAGFYMDTVFRWFVVLADAPGIEELERTARLMEGWRRSEPAFAAPCALVTRGMLEAMCSTAHLDTPFLKLCLRGARGLRPLSRFPVWRGHFRLGWNLDCESLPGPSRESALQAAADLGLSLRLYGLDAWAGDNAYRLLFLYGRILSLRLYLEKGEARDPQDIDSLLEAFGRAFPESRPWLSRLEQGPLSWSKERLDSIAPSELFYEHYPFLRECLRAAGLDMMDGLVEPHPGAVPFGPPAGRSPGADPLPAPGLD